MRREIIKLRSSILVMLTHKIALPVLKLFRKTPVFVHSMDDIKGLPEGTLGYDLHKFLEKRNLVLLSHYARHDIKHVLLNYDTTDEGEACLQCFMLGNGRISFPVVATVFFGIISMPEHWGRMRSAFNQGRRCHSFHGWNWNEMVFVQTKELRDKIFA